MLLLSWRSLLSKCGPASLQMNVTVFREWEGGFFCYWRFPTALYFCMGKRGWSSVSLEVCASLGVIHIKGKALFSYIILVFWILLGLPSLERELSHNFTYQITIFEIARPFWASYLPISRFEDLDFKYLFKIVKRVQLLANCVHSPFETHARAHFFLLRSLLDKFSVPSTVYSEEEGFRRWKL